MNDETIAWLTQTMAEVQPAQARGEVGTYGGAPAHMIALSRTLDVRIVVLPKETLDNWQRCLQGPAAHASTTLHQRPHKHQRPLSPLSYRGVKGLCDIFRPDNRKGEGDTMELARLVPFLEEALKGDDPPIIVYFDRVGAHFASHPFAARIHPPPPWLKKNVENAEKKRSRPKRHAIHGIGGGS